MKLSVIIPTYNRAKYLPACLDSVLNQKSMDFEYEVIVIDDGSTDNTLKLVESRYSDKISLIKLPHSGRPAIVRNAGMKAATGEFIAFQDSDDIWVDDKLFSQLPDFEDPKVVLSYGNNGYITPSGKKIAFKRGTSHSLPINGYGFMRKLSKQPAPVPTPTVIIRKNVIGKIGLFNEKLIIATDNDYWLRVAKTGDFHYCDKVLAYMRRDGSNISSIPSESGYEAVFKHETNRLEMFKQLKKELSLSEEEQKAIDYRIAELKLEIYEASKKIGEKVDFDIESVKLPPKPDALIEVDKLYSKTAFGQIDKLAQTVLVASPGFYKISKKVGKRLIAPFRRSI